MLSLRLNFRYKNLHQNVGTTTVSWQTIETTKQRNDH